jgi:integrase
MKLSKLTYHNGAVKVEVYQKGQDRKRWNTGVRVNKTLLNKDKFIKPNDLIDWQDLNVKIGEEKERVDRAVRQVYKEEKYVDVLKVFEILNEQEANVKANIEANRSRALLKNGNVRKRLGGAITELRDGIKLNGVKKGNVAKYATGETQTEEHQLKLDNVKRGQFINELRQYLLKESLVTSQATIAKHFVDYLEEGTSIVYSGLIRHYHIFEFMIENPIFIEDATDSWVLKLQVWLRKGVKGKEINGNTSDWMFGRFQCFWTWALNSNVVNKRFHWKKFKRQTYKSGFVWLTEERISQLAKRKFDDQQLECSRMAYLVLSLTGLRHSDFHSLKPSEIVFENGKYYIHKSNKKTKSAFKAGVHQFILDWVRNESCLRKMKLSVNRGISNTRLNKNIREIGKEMGWTEQVRLQKGFDKWVSKPFYKWMNCHSARHTAVSVWLAEPVDPTTIKKWIGWKGSKMIDYYADILNIDTKVNINDVIKL